MDKSESNTIENKSFSFYKEQQVDDTKIYLEMPSFINNSIKKISTIKTKNEKDEDKNENENEKIALPKSQMTNNYNDYSTDKFLQGTSNNFVDKNDSLSISSSRIKKKTFSEIHHSQNGNHNKNHSKISNQSIDFKDIGMEKDEIINIYQSFENKEFTDEFLEEMRDKVEISQGRGKMYDLFLSRDEANVLFDYNKFSKFFIYHLLFFFVLGPILGIILIPIEGIEMVLNMGFLGFNFGFFLQFLIFCAGGLNLYLTIFYKYYYEYNGKVGGMLQYLEISELIFCLIAILIRILIIAFRYGYTSDYNIQQRYKGKVDTSTEFLITGWRQITSKTIDIEVFYSIIRQQIDIEFYLFNFFSYIDKEWIERLCSEEYHNINDNKTLKIDVNQIISQEKQIKSVIDKVLIDSKQYSQLKPFLSKIKNERKLKSNQKSQSSVKNINDNKGNNPEQLIKNSTNSSTNNKSSNKKNHKGPMSKAYNDLIFKMSSKMKNTGNYFSNPYHREDESCLPFYMRKPSFKILSFDFPGRILTREILFLSRQQSSPVFFYFVTIFIILHSFIPMIYRYSTSKPPFGETALEIYMIIINFLMQIFVFMVSCLFIESGGNDYARREFCLQSLSALITPDKYFLKTPFKLYPTINFICPKNLKSWIYLRLLIMDVGLRYMKRVELYASTFLFFYAVLVITLVLGNLDILKGFNFNTYPVFFIMGYAETFIVFLCLYRMMLVGARVNSYFEKHKCELEYIKSTYKYLLLNWEIWKEMSSYVNPYLQSTKMMYYFCLYYSKTSTKEELEFNKLNDHFIPSNEEEFKQLLVFMIENIDYSLERLELEEKVRPVKLLGITINNDLMTQFYIAIITLLYTIIQYVIGNISSPSETNTNSHVNTIRLDL